MDRDERIRTARAWSESLGERGPNATDVLIVAALDLGPGAPLGEFLWQSPASLRQNWARVRAVLQGEPDPGISATGEPAQAPRSSYPSAAVPTAPVQAGLSPQSPLPPKAVQPNAPMPYPSQQPPPGYPSQQPPPGYPSQQPPPGYPSQQPPPGYPPQQPPPGYPPQQPPPGYQPQQPPPGYQPQPTPRTRPGAGVFEASRSFLDRIASQIDGQVTRLVPGQQFVPGQLTNSDRAPEVRSGVSPSYPSQPGPAYPAAPAASYPAVQPQPVEAAPEPAPTPAPTPDGPLQRGEAPLAQPRVAASAGRDARPVDVAEPTPVASPPGPALLDTVAPVVAPDQQPGPAADWIEPLGPFAAFSFDGYTGEMPILPGMIVERVDGGMRLSWPPASDAPCAIYRVVEASEQWSYVQPERGTVGATRLTQVLAPLRQGAGSVTYLTVWVNEGETEFAARDAQPRLVAKGEVVWPPRGLSVSSTPVGEIAGRFQAPAGASVEVQRFVESEMTTPRVAYDQSRTLASGVLSNGFVDRDAPKGPWLIYAIYSVAQTPEGIKYSDPITERVRFLPDPESVEITVEPGLGGPGTFDISWTPPEFGTVEVFLSQDQPSPGLGDATRTLEVLEMNGVPSQGLPYPVATHGGRSRIVGVAMNPAWVKGFFYAVHRVSEDAVRLGAVESRVNAQPPRYPLLVERVNTQVITFQWPKGVRMVEVFQGPLSEESIDPSRSEVIASLTEEDYKQRGGLRLERPLPANGCALYLFSVVYDQGRKELSEATRLPYPGIARLEYRIEPARRDGQQVSGTGRPDFYRVQVRAVDQMRPTSLCLMALGSRLPLHPRDQEEVDMPFYSFPDVSPMPGQVVTLGEFPAGDRSAFVRLFVSSPSMEDCGSLAILDPDIAMLRVWV